MNAFERSRIEAPTIVGFTQFIFVFLVVTTAMFSSKIVKDFMLNLSVWLRRARSSRTRKALTRFRMLSQHFPKAELFMILKKFSAILLVAACRNLVFSSIYFAIHFDCLNLSTLCSFEILRPFRS